MLAPAGTFSLGLPLVFLCAVRICVLIPSSCKDISYIGAGPTLMAPFQFNYAFKDPIFKYSHILQYWLGLRLNVKAITIKVLGKKNTCKSSLPWVWQSLFFFFLQSLLR